MTKTLKILALVLCAIALSRPVHADALTATLTYPANGAVNADMQQPIAWTTVTNAQAYYLYVGTTVGAQNLVNTGAIQSTSYLASGLPSGQTLYARIWAQVGGSWRYTDSTFSASASVALTPTLTYPANGAVNADMAQAMTWTTVANAQAYYLYVGTTAGAQNLVNTGAIQATSYQAAGLPSGQTLYARVWAQVGGVWRYTDSTFSAAASAPLKPTLTYPASGAVNADMTQPMTWTTVANAQAYYLYVGTTVGAQNLVNTGTIQSTSYQAAGLPSGQTLYARVWAQVGGVWRYTDSTFSAAASVPVKPTMTYPADGAVNANMLQPMTWTTVANAQSYYLYVGTTAGSFNVVDSRELQSTSYLVSNVPSGQTLYVRVWAQVGGVWRYNDSTFTAAPMAATVIYPANGAVNADMSQPVTWTSVSNVQAYSLHVGTTLGAQNLLASGETLQTSFLAANLPSGQTLYARMWTKSNNVWRYTDSTFTAAPPVPVTATLTYPANGATGIDQSQPATWTTVANAEMYYLYVGSTPGALDIVDSQQVQTTSFPIAYIPFGQTLYARLWTRVAGVWRYTDSTFSAAPLAPVFAYPTDGAVAVDAGQAFSWIPPANSQLHHLIVGTAPGTGDLFDSGDISATSVQVTGLPSAGVLYARVLSRVNGTWRHTDIAFSLETPSALSAIQIPVDGQTGFDTSRPFTWTAIPLARAYRLRIGTTPGAHDLHDSGEIRVTERFVPNLPLGLTYGRIEAKVGGQWYANDFTFTVGANSVSSVFQIKSALRATHLVRTMALADNRPFTWTDLADTILARRTLTSMCDDYAATLLRVIGEMNIQLQARRLDVALNPNGTDAHTLVEMFNSATNSWLLLDPTFDLTIKRAGGTAYATAEDVSAATRALQWTDVSYQFLGSAGDAFVRNYHLDYPTLFVNVYHQGEFQVNGQGGPVLPYMEAVPMPMAISQGVYAVGCGTDQTAQVRVDHVDTVIDCSGVDGLSVVFVAGLIETTAQTSSSVVVYRPRRFVF